MGFVNGFVVDDQGKNRDATFNQDALLDARDESLRKERQLLQMEQEAMEKERAAFLSERKLREEGRGLREKVAATEAQLQERTKSETILRAELQTSWDQMQQREAQDQRRASVTAQTRRTLELQERKLDDQHMLIQSQTEQISHLESMMTSFTADVKATFCRYCSITAEPRTKFQHGSC